MARDLLFGQLHPDLACAIALGIVQHPHVSVTIHAITWADPRQRTSHTKSDWLSSDDPLDLLTREYLQARQEAMQQVIRPGQAAWAVANARRIKEEANARAIAARAKSYRLLEERGVLTHAVRSGLNVVQAS